MKKIFYSMIGAATLCLGLASCMKIDNWDAPSAHISGTVIDSYTNQPLVQDQNDWQIRIWEKSWTASVAQPQNLVTKADGTYNNTKLFTGTYDMLAYGGPFWPNDTIKGVVFGNATVQDFTVTPYLQILEFTTAVNDTSLTVTCKVKAPLLSKTINTNTGPVVMALPNLYDVKAFISLDNFCGNSNYINIPEYNNLRLQINKAWGTYVPGGADTTPVLTMGPFPLKSGYTYRVRVGACVNDANRKYNYSPMVTIAVPSKKKS